MAVQKIGSPVVGRGHVEAKRVMTGRQQANGRVGRMPRRHHHPAAHRVRAEGIDHGSELVEGQRAIVLAGYVRMIQIHPHLAAKLRSFRWKWEAPPETSIRCLEVAFSIGPRVPDLRVLAQFADVIGAGEIPEHLAEHRAEIDLLRRQQWVPFRQIHRIELSER